MCCPPIPPSNWRRSASGCVPTCSVSSINRTVSSWATKSCLHSTSLFRRSSIVGTMLRKSSLRRGNSFASRNARAAGNRRISERSLRVQFFGVDETLPSSRPSGERVACLQGSEVRTVASFALVSMEISHLFQPFPFKTMLFTPFLPRESRSCWTFSDDMTKTGTTNYLAAKSMNWCESSILFHGMLRVLCFYAQEKWRVEWLQDFPPT